MAGVEKIVEKMNRQPHGIRFEEISKVLNYLGYIEVRADGSHHHFRNKNGDVVTIKKSQPVKAAYVKDVLRRIGK